ncbi:MAG: methylenetetrahydrofolate reductase [Sedimentisphaerales bacterium]|nr:methylenetetrahydrofolate reductase [Sedimentisphaerales bacterium]
MTQDSKLAQSIDKGNFIITAEYLPRASAVFSLTEDVITALKSFHAVNVADNPYGIVMSSLAGAMGLSQAGIEPIYQLVTRDRNRIALGSDLLGAASLGIKNVLCLSGYHQTLTKCPESANVYDIDSIQLADAVNKMNNDKVLPDGIKIEGDFSMLIGSVANQNLKPLELNMIRLAKKIEAGAKFIQTQAIFDVKVFAEWLEAADKEGLTKKTAILASVMPLEDAQEGEILRDTFTDYNIPDEIIGRIKKAGDKEAQRKEGLKISVEIINEVKKLTGLRGIHILSGGNEAILPELLSQSGLGK